MSAPTDTEAAAAVAWSELGPELRDWVLCLLEAELAKRRQISAKEVVDEMAAKQKAYAGAAVLAEAGPLGQSAAAGMIASMEAMGGVEMGDPFEVALVAAIQKLEPEDADR
jgi:lipid-binding SYLF domain-containing protein